MRAPEASEGRSEGAVILGQRAPAGSNSDCTNEALLRFNLGFVNQHDGNIIFNGVDSPALAALQPLPVAGELHRAFAQGTNQNIQQFLAYGHGRLPWLPTSLAAGTANRTWEVGFVLVERRGAAPSLGEVIELPETPGARLMVAKLASSPLPHDRRICVYLNNL